MDIGQRLKQARLESGFTQRQLCGDVITRNMLSQIENGSARPSMETLRYLAGRLGKPMGYFLEEQTASPNQETILAARTAFQQNDWQKALSELAGFAGDDPVFDSERYLLEALSLMNAAQQALENEKTVYARELLHRVEAAGKKTPYFTKDMQRQYALLLSQAEPEQADVLAARLPSAEPEWILRARAAMAAGDAQKAVRLLTAEDISTPQGQFLLGEGYLALGEYAKAAEQFQKAETAYPRQAAEKMEVCFREMGDYKMAYYYATKLRNQE